MTMNLDPRTKLIMVLCVTTLAIVYSTVGALFLLLLATTVILFIFGIDFRQVVKNLKPFFVLLLVLFLAQCIFTPGGEVLLAIGPVRLLTSEGLLMGTSVVLRLLVVIAAALLLSTSNSRDFITGLVQWKVPYEIAFMVSVTIRFLPVFRDEFVNVVTAVQLRGVELKQVPWGKKIYLFRSLFFPVVYGAILTAQQLSVAMEARGFRAYPQRTYLRQLYLNRWDYCLMLVCPGLTLLMIGLYVIH